MTNRDKKSIYILIAVVLIAAFYFRWKHDRDLERINTAPFKSQGEDQVQINEMKLKLLYSSMNKARAKAAATKSAAAPGTGAPAASPTPPTVRYITPSAPTQAH